MPRIPDRWEAYTPMGRTVGNTNFIPFKVPLKLTLCKQLPEVKKFTPFHLLNMVERLGLVIDLTNTRRYYNPEELTSSGVRYVKIFCQGHGSVPSHEIVRKFYDAVRDFLNENKDGLIGVHCTHGLNRTGYLICRYMIENLGYSAGDAINEFNKARGHDIERPEYLKDLHEIEGKHINAEKFENTEVRGRTYNHYPTKYKSERYHVLARNLPSNSRGYGRSYHQSNKNVYHQEPAVDYLDRNSASKTEKKNNGWGTHHSYNETASYLPLRYTYPFQAHYGNSYHRNKSNSFANASHWHHAYRQSELN